MNIYKRVIKIFLSYVMITPTFWGLVVAGVNPLIAVGVAICAALVARTCIRIEDNL